MIKWCKLIKLISLFILSLYKIKMVCLPSVHHFNVLKLILIQAWCDVDTAGGGFMLVGKKDSPVTWTVPSNPTPVDPKGLPHWSSEFGDLEVLDFAIQISVNSDVTKGTQAHW
jgi:hypothetical protein